MVTLHDVRSSLKASLGAAVVSLIVAVVLASVTVHMATSVAQVHADLTQTTLDLARLDAIVADSKTYATSAAVVRQSIPDGYGEVATAVAAIESLAQRSPIALETKVDDIAKPESGTVRSLTLTFRVSGSYTAIRSFLSGLARLRYHTRVQSIQLDNTNTLSGTISVKLYIQ